VFVVGALTRKRRCALDQLWSVQAVYARSGGRAPAPRRVDRVRQRHANLPRAVHEPAVSMLIVFPGRLVESPLGQIATLLVGENEVG
jgi:hypothetical protein